MAKIKKKKSVLSFFEDMTKLYTNPIVENPEDFEMVAASLFLYHFSDEQNNPYSLSEVFNVLENNRVPHQIYSKFKTFFTFSLGQKLSSDNIRRLSFILKDKAYYYAVTDF